MKIDENDENNAIIIGPHELQKGADISEVYVCKDATLTGGWKVLKDMTDRLREENRSDAP